MADPYIRQMAREALAQTARNPNQDFLQATPRNSILGFLSDLAASSYSPERTQQMQGVAQFMGAPAISETLNRLSYGEPLTTGAGGIGGTTRIRPEALEAAMTLAPMVAPTARMAGAGAMAAGQAGERFAERAVPQIMQRGGFGSELLQGMSRGTVSPLDVYHGTPYKFDRFDSSKIGSGEGAQAYGHGLYFAENPVVAQGYKDTLAYKAFDISPEAEKLGFTLNAGARGEFIKQSRVNKSPEAKARSLQNANIAARDVPQEKLAELFKAYEKQGGGNFYKVDLPDEQIAKMLDWDKPLSQQAPEVRQALEAADRRAKDSLYQTGGEYYRALMSRHAQNAPSHMALDAAENAAQSPASEQLRALGIPGIKYLDEGSRSNFKIQNTYKGQPYGDPVTFMTEQQASDYAKEQIAKGFGIENISGTRNFVVFPGNENMLTILERNNQPAQQSMQEFEQGLTNFIATR